MFWSIGSLAILLGAWLAGRVEPVLGASTQSYAITLLIAFMLIFFGGFAWIAVSVAVTEEEEVEVFEKELESKE